MKCKFFVPVGLSCLLLAVFAANSAQAQTFETLYMFTGPDGNHPFNDPMLVVNGTLFGTTSWGGANSGGTLYKLDRQGTERTLYNFCSAADCADGWEPQSNLVQDIKHNLYGVALLAGTRFLPLCQQLWLRHRVQAGSKRELYRAVHL